MQLDYNFERKLEEVDLMSRSREGMKEMAELLRSGAKMLSYSCPECGSPLFQLKSADIWCANCQKRVVIVPEDEDESEASERAIKEMLWNSLEQTLINKLSSLNSSLSKETEPKRVGELVEVISMILNSLDRLGRCKKS